MPFARQKALAMLALALWSAAAGATEKVTLYGDDDYAPYSYVEDGRFKGMYVDILQRAAQRLAPEYQVELQPRPWTRALAELEKGVSFALFPPGLKRERPYIEPYSVPLYRETVVLFCNEQVMSAPHSRFPEDFTGIKIGVNAGFLLSSRLMDAVHASVVAIEPAKGNETNLKKLAAGRIACYASDRLAAVYSAKKLGASLGNGKFVLREAVELSGENTYIAYSMYNNPPYKADFVKKMNDALQEMKRSGEIERVEQAYSRR
jgi:polar amino acid transport system substrate-binding protein